MPERNLVSWTSLLAAYSHREKVEYAPKKSSFVEFHACGICPKRAYTQNQELFEAMPERDLVSWTTMVASYTQTDHLESAKSVFESMPERNSMAWKAMIAAHARQVEEAKFTFDQMPLQSLVSLNTVIFAYGQSGYCDEAYNAMPEIPDDHVFGLRAQRTHRSRCQVLRSVASSGHHLLEDDSRGLYSKRTVYQCWIRMTSSSSRQDVLRVRRAATYASVLLANIAYMNSDGGLVQSLQMAENLQREICLQGPKRMRQQ
ncbi:pentatricopeptide repeat-containing protein At4g02750-like [Selaginella moellendorffii]|uniref:pentatricopeptide repeat-containing protein At4g02750-like n=1 Tax=Selaginella moellendorffii TaxID=88036 RepID=UPI000D1C66C4|nr:pentatricopeptide repeat-containing protein At4g02750-like [Selaginella moellendorffii]|eukprot:XP_024537813.1 pentatricopeptide repeat-containing protein At4g02750-like [Selaginella moellendorffii]